VTPNRARPNRARPIWARPIWATAAAAAVVFMTSGALAQDARVSSDDLLGAWSFEAAPTYDGCSLTGEVFIRRGVTPDTFLCEMTAQDVCPNVWSYRAKENCTATRNGDKLTIESRLVTVDPSTDRYLPDDFDLLIIDGSNMVGELRSAMIATARFFRSVGPIS
jgi:hypothetical protein